MSALIRPRPGSLLRGLRRSERGQAMVEFALVVPLFLIMVFGVVEFGALMMNKIHVARAADVGARTGSLKGGTTATAISAAASAVTGLISCTAATPTANYGGSPTQITVTASCTYAPITPVGSLASFAVPTAVSSTIVMRAEP